MTQVLETLDIARKRAEMPNGLRVMSGRTLERDCETLVRHLKPGMRVLDAGCGTGTITQGIARLVNPGLVVGVDNNPGLISEAVQLAQGIDNISFEKADVYDLNRYAGKFDVVASSRTIQWVNDPLRALRQLKGAAKDGGLVYVLEENYPAIRWQPEPPGSMIKFYNAFLKWRHEMGMGNELADEMRFLFNELQFKSIETQEQPELVRRGIEPDFDAKIGIWKLVAEKRGPQIVKDGYITEAVRRQAIEEYGEWVEHDAQSQTSFYKATWGRK